MRYFQVPEGRTLVLPQGVQAGPGSTNMRVHAGGVITLDPNVATDNQRFLNGRVRAGDLVELDATRGAALAKLQEQAAEKAAEARAKAKEENAAADIPIEPGPIEVLPKPDPNKPILRPTAGNPLGGGVISNPAKG